MLAPSCHSVIIDDSCTWTVGNDGFECPGGENTILSEVGDVSRTESSNVPASDSRSSGNKPVT